MTADRWALFLSLVAMAVTPGITPPVESRTTPVRSLFMVWAVTIDGSSRPHRAANTMTGLIGPMPETCFRIRMSTPRS